MVSRSFLEGARGRATDSSQIIGEQQVDQSSEGDLRTGNYYNEITAFQMSDSRLTTCESFEKAMVTGSVHP
jgi:hypothetical protein